MIQRPIYKTTGNDNSWPFLGGGYIGSVLSSFVAIFILYKQLKQNHDENIHNSELQLSVLKYQQKMLWLNTLKDKFVDYYTAFSFNDLSFLGDNIINKTEKEEIRKDIKRLLDKMAAADFNQGIISPKDLDKYEIKYLSEIKELTEIFYSLLKDLDWYVFDVAFYNGSFDLNKKMYKEKTDTYKNREDNMVNSKINRIWAIIEKKDYNIFDNNKEIIAEMMQGFKKGVEPEKVQKSIMQLIDYEQNKINSILTTKGPYLDSNQKSEGTQY